MNRNFQQTGSLCLQQARLCPKSPGVDREQSEFITWKACHPHISLTIHLSYYLIQSRETKVSKNFKRMTEKVCFLCSRVCDKVCSYCQKVSYCSEKHFKYHRNNDTCYPFKVIDQVRNCKKKQRKIFEKIIFR